MAVVEFLSLEGNLEPNSQTGDEVLVVLTIERDAVHKSDGVRLGVKVEANNEWQPVLVGRALGGCVLAAGRDESTDRVALADGHLLDLALKVGPVDGRVRAVVGSSWDVILGLEHQSAVCADSLASGGLDRADNPIAFLGECDDDLASVNGDLLAGVLDVQVSGLALALALDGRSLDSVFVGDSVGLRDRVC